MSVCLSHKIPEKFIKVFSCDGQKVQVDEYFCKAYEKHEIKISMPTRVIKRCSELLSCSEQWDEADTGTDFSDSVTVWWQLDNMIGWPRYETSAGSMRKWGYTSCRHFPSSQHRLSAVCEQKHDLEVQLWSDEVFVCSCFVSSAALPAIVISQSHFIGRTVFIFQV